jgi:hypothetical protein
MVPNVANLLGFAFVMGAVQAVCTLVFYSEMGFWMTRSELGRCKMLLTSIVV